MPIDVSGHIDYINSLWYASWVSGHNSKFDGASLKEVRQTMGTIVDSDWTVKSHLREHSTEAKANLPSEFDSRQEWPECADVIGHVRDQSNCGSCWAHGTTEAFNDRKCIKSNGAFQELLSVSDTTGCCGFLSC